MLLGFEHGNTPSICNSESHRISIIEIGFWGVLLKLRQLIFNLSLEMTLFFSFPDVSNQSVNLYLQTVFVISRTSSPSHIPMPRYTLLYYM